MHFLSTWCVLIITQLTSFFCQRLLCIILLLPVNFLAADVFSYEYATGNIRFYNQPYSNPTLAKLIPKNSRHKHTVATVYDGDTITLKNGERVRLLGLNAPEIDSHYRRGEAGGQQAKKWLASKLQKSVVFLEYGQQKRDKYKRLLAHLFLPNGEHLNQSMLAQGLATLTIIPPNLRYANKLILAENTALKLSLGVWSMPEYKAITAQSLPKKYSSWQRILATAKAIKTTKKYAYLILSKNADVRIPKNNLDLFPDLAEYLGKPLEIRSWVSRNKQHYSILVRHPSVIIVR